jgi:pilus assembly protein CpaC
MLFHSLLLTASFLAAHPDTVPMPPAPLMITRELGATRELSMEVGQSRLMESSVPLGRVSVANPDVADVKVVTNNQLLVTAKGVGETHLSLWDKADKPLVISLRVTRNLETLRRQINDLFPNEPVKVSAAGDLVVISGEVSDVRLPDRILSVARLYAPKVANLLSVHGEQQVQVEIKFAEVSRTALRQIGVNFFHAQQGRMAGLAGPNQPAGFPPAPFTPPSSAYGVPEVYPQANASTPTAFTLFYSMAGKFPFSATLSLLEQNQLSKTLAEPTLVAITGQEAKFLAGGEFPVPLTSTLGQVTVEFKKFGIQLKIVPTVLADGLVSLKLGTEVSELDPANGITLNNITIPGLSTRSSETTIRLSDGQSFAIAGLLSDKVRSNISKLPGLGDIPILGALFRSTSFQRDETELLVVVTTHLVRPVGPQDAPLLPGEEELNDPDDFELFLLGKSGTDPKLPQARAEAIPVQGYRTGGPAGDIGFSR